MDGDFVELEDAYLKFFEDVLEENEDISVASVKESIGSLNVAIDYCQIINYLNVSVRYPSICNGRWRLNLVCLWLANEGYRILAFD